MNVTPEIISEVTNSIVLILGAFGTLFTTIIIGIYKYTIKPMHKEAIGELKGINTTIAVHAEKLEGGSREFGKIAIHQKEQDLKIAEIEKTQIEHGTAITNVENDFKEFKTRKLN